MSEERNERGQFVAGNGGGPGRPRRPIEREYIAALSDTISLDDWRAIVSKAKTLALAGDSKAREWIAKYLLGETPITITELLARELLDIDADLEALVKVDELSETSAGKLIAWTTPTFVERARDVQARISKSEAAADRKPRRAARQIETAN